MSFSSTLRAPRSEVWAVVSTMKGVNAELRPFVRMTYPHLAEELSEAAIVPGNVLFRSWLLAGSVIPIDRHDLSLERVIDGESFDEESTSVLQRRWRHERRVHRHPRGWVHRPRPLGDRASCGAHPPHGRQDGSILVRPPPPGPASAIRHVSLQAGTGARSGPSQPPGRSAPPAPGSIGCRP